MGENSDTRQRHRWDDFGKGDNRWAASRQRRRAHEDSHDAGDPLPCGRPYVTKGPTGSRDDPGSSLSNFESVRPEAHLLHGGRRTGDGDRHGPRGVGKTKTGKELTRAHSVLAVTMCMTQADSSREFFGANGPSRGTLFQPRLTAPSSQGAKTCRGCLEIRVREVPPHEARLGISV